MGHVLTKIKSNPLLTISLMNNEVINNNQDKDTSMIVDIYWFDDHNFRQQCMYNVQSKNMSPRQLLKLHATTQLKLKNSDLFNYCETSRVINNKLNDSLKKLNQITIVSMANVRHYINTGEGQEYASLFLGEEDNRDAKDQTINQTNESNDASELSETNNQNLNLDHNVRRSPLKDITNVML